MFPFSIRVEDGDSLRTLGARWLAEAHGLLRHTYPGGGPASGASASNVVLNYFSGTFGTFDGIPIASEWLHPGESDRIHALRLQVHDYDATGCYTLQFDFNEDTFDRTLRTRAVRHFERLLPNTYDHVKSPKQKILASTEKGTSAH